MAQPKPNITYKKTVNGVTVNFGGGATSRADFFKNNPSFMEGMKKMEQMQKMQEMQAKAYSTNHSQPVYPEKQVTNQFNFNGSTIDNCAIGGKGPSTFNTKQTTYQKGATHSKVNISGGSFNQASIGGNNTFHNKNSSITATDGAPGGIIQRGKWDYDVEGTILTILKKGLTTEQLLQALEKGKTLQDLCKAVEKLTKSQVEVMFDSLLNSNPDDMEQ